MSTLQRVCCVHITSNNMNVSIFLAISRSSQCSTTGVTKAVVYVIQSVGTLAANRKE